MAKSVPPAAPVKPTGKPAPFATSHIRILDPKIKRPHAAVSGYGPGQMPKAYGMPVGIDIEDGTLVIFELGGKFYSGDVPIWAQAAGMPAPNVTTHLLSGADDSAGDADGEVALDWQKAVEFVIYMTGKPPKNTLLLYGPNSGTAFGDCHKYAATLPDVFSASWSWGAPESGWSQSDMDYTDSTAAACKFPISAASGDNDATDGTGSPITDCPACLASITGCGGTSFPQGGAETVWNNGQGEGTGGGFSKVVSKPSWQPTNSQGTGRMVPDIAMNADPNTGHSIVTNGVWNTYGGTSAVAPMFAGIMYVVNGARKKKGLPLISVANPELWSRVKDFFDIVQGNNSGYNATVGPDPCTGLGRPLATLIYDLIGDTSPPPPPPPPPPPGGSTGTVSVTTKIAAGTYALNIGGGSGSLVAPNGLAAGSYTLGEATPPPPPPPPPTGPTEAKVQGDVDAVIAKYIKGVAWYPPFKRYLQQLNSDVDATIKADFTGVSAAILQPEFSITDTLAALKKLEEFTGIDPSKITIGQITQIIEIIAGLFGK